MSTGGIARGSLGVERDLDVFDEEGSDRFFLLFRSGKGG